MGQYQGLEEATAVTKDLPRVLDFAADSSGNLWGIETNGSVLRFDKQANKWEYTGMGEAVSISAGPFGHVYVLGKPIDGDEHQIYSWKWGKWNKVRSEKKAVSIAVGKEGRLYIVDG